jgi:signal transduction histidine kinase
LDDKLSELLADAQKAAGRARNLTQQLLTFSKREPPLTRVVSMAGLLKDALTFALSASRVKFECSIPEDLWWVPVEEGQIGQVIQNLIINADQAMPAGGTITICAQNMMVGPEHALPLPEGNYVKVSLADKGVGIPDEYLPRVFDPFYTTRENGTGLGLAISSTIIKRHHGTIEVESELGIGTTFHIYLPALKNRLSLEYKDSSSWERS